MLNIKHIVIVLFVALQLFSVTVIFGQDEEYKPTRTFGSGLFLSLENNFIDVGDFDDLLKDNNLLSCKYEPSAMGYGFFMQVNHWIAALSVNSSDKTIKNNVSRSKTEYYSFSVNLGYDLIPSPRFSVYPLIGYKSSTISYTYYELFPNIDGFGSYLSASLNEKKLSYSRGYVNTGISANYYRFIHVGLQTGLLFAPGKGKWLIQEEENNYENSPKINHKFYFSVMLGFSLFNRNNGKNKFSI